ncbi:hypothetical protein ACFVT1_36545 [Streptomyces sp. NPDC057963]|uniref:hypothetical protein n=1 Tax=Streptomyces sp. NPDC057963 TaxID=3346290 RepID=UPI0036DFA6BD
MTTTPADELQSAAVEMIHRICPAHLDRDEYGRLLAERFAAHRAAVLREAADEIAGIDFHPNAVARSLDIAAGLACRLRRMADEAQQAAPAVAEEQRVTADLLATSATEYRVPVPEQGGTNLHVRRQSLVFGVGWSVAVPGWGGGRAWTQEGWQEAISALSVDRLFCWPDAATAVDEARRALAVTEEPGQ